MAAKRFGLNVHMDGARFANAVASLKVAPKEVTWQAGVDVLCGGMGGIDRHAAHGINHTALRDAGMG